MDPRVTALDDTTAKRLAGHAQAIASHDDATQLVIAFAEAVESGENRGNQMRAIVQAALTLGVLTDADLPAE